MKTFMNNRTNRRLLASFLTSSALLVLILLNVAEIIKFPFYDPYYTLQVTETMMVLVIILFPMPGFFLELLICHAAKRPILRLIPVLLVAGWYLLIIIMAYTPLHNIAFGLYLFSSFPSAGIVPAWCLYTIKKRNDKARQRGANPDA